MKENRLTPAESFSFGSGVRGAFIARTGSLTASGGNAVPGCAAGSWGCDCRAGCDCEFCPAASAKMQSSAMEDARICLNILSPIYFNFLLKTKALWRFCGRGLSSEAIPPQKFFQTFLLSLANHRFSTRTINTISVKVDGTFFAIASGVRHA